VNFRRSATRCSDHCCTPSDSAETYAILGIGITLLSIVIAIVVGVTQFPDARRFVCSQWGYICDRTNTVRLFAVDFEDGATQPPEGWDALMSLKTSYDLPNDCINDPPGMTSPNEIVVGQQKWVFNGVSDIVTQQVNRVLIFDLFSQYDFGLKRDVKVTVNVTVKQNTQPRPDYHASYQVIHPEGTQDFWMSCRLYYPGVGDNEFDFHIIDDFFHADEPITKSVRIQAPFP
jgi:hypothetical protein